jgi:hypothetical protein
MPNVIRVARFIAVWALIAGLGLPAGVQAGAQEPQELEKQKLTDLIRAQMLLSQGEHEKFHEALEKLAKKYPDDADIKNLVEVHHETMHERMQAEEQVRQELMRRNWLTTP